jgi:glycogen debranching enzyme
VRILYIPLDSASHDSTAWRWLETANLNARQTGAGDLAGVSVSSGTVLWIDAQVQPEPDPTLARALHAASGALLTGQAVALPALLGLEEAPPNESVNRIWQDDQDELFLFKDFAETPRIRGHAAFRRHSLFEGLGSGVYTWWPHNGDPYRRLTYRLPEWPALAGVVAVERAFIHIQSDHATIWEYAKPRLLCVGAFLPFESADPLFKPHLNRLMLNALLYLARPTHPPARDQRTRGFRLAPDLHWRAPDPHTRQDETLGMPAALDRFPVTSDTLELPFDLDALRLPGRSPEDPCTIAGRRAFAAMQQGEGIAELWCHPVRVMKEASLLSAQPGAAEISTLGITRSITIGNRSLTERGFLPLALPAAIIEWSLPHNHPAEREPVLLRFDWTTDLSLMWPYPGSAPGALLWQTRMNCLLVQCAHTRERVLFVATDPRASFNVEDTSHDDAASIRCSLTANLDSHRPLRLIIAAETADGDDLDAILGALLNPDTLVRAQAARSRRLQQDRLSLHSPDDMANAAFQWARFRLDSFLVETPGLGTSLVAGYWTSRPGWNQARPGYAWYFGRDAVWTALASLAIADFDAARNVIAFLCRHQDLTGKILHECTTSGSVHYDAADATPLFLLLVARYHAWSGDHDFTNAHWHHVRRALDFCIATDTDGDGLIENTRVGHGWIEFGKLGGGRATFYNAGIWTAALRDLAVTARSLGDLSLAAELEQRHRRARDAIEARFFDPRRNAYALRIEPQDFTPTATHAVPILLGVADPARAEAWLDTVASPQMTTPWGVRMLPDSDPTFNPASYHGGAVWPLYTGWTSWAEYVTGRSEAAFRHWRINLALASQYAPGEWPEVLHGSNPASIGVCPSQAWSTAMAIAPLVYGMLGAEPDAARGRLRLRLQLPAEWDHFKVEGLRLGEAMISIRFRREGSRHIFQVAQYSGASPVRLVLEAAVPGRIVSARVDGRDAALDVRPFGERYLAPVQLVLDHERQFELEIGS